MTKTLSLHAAVDKIDIGSRFAVFVVGFVANRIKGGKMETSLAQKVLVFPLLILLVTVKVMKLRWWIRRFDWLETNISNLILTYLRPLNKICITHKLFNFVLWWIGWRFFPFEKFMAGLQNYNTLFNFIFDISACVI